MIKVTSLSRFYGDFAAVKNVSFEIQSGQIVGLLGHNGAGKTTIMKMLTGFLEPSEGSIEIDGKPLNENLQFCRQLIGYLPEAPPLYPEMRVIDFLDYTANLRGVAFSQKAQAIRNAIAQTDLGEKALAPISTLSRGYRQRVGVAQAVINRPKILILDEPTNGLDPSQIQHMRDLIQEFREHSTVILSTHILQEVTAICDRAMIIRHGQLALNSRLDELHHCAQLTLITNKPKLELQHALANIEALTLLQSKELPGQRFEHLLQVDQQDNVHLLAADVARTISNLGWPIYALHPQMRDLESVFAEINSKTESSYAA
jgi:ABC-2 type transport system ATP-binding protein